MQTAAEKFATKLKSKTIDTPCGELTLFATADALVAVYFEDHRKQNPYDAEKTNGAHRILDSAERDLRAYFSGKNEDLVNHAARPHENRSEFKTPIAMSGTPFQLNVWRGLLQIPFGETWSYSDLAKKIGKPKAVRAVGMASSKNPISILVPCHRVIGANGSLTGYGGGLENKKWLLDHEASQRSLL
jgi:methylated-DNA-[protein]-cysteine S-methyltransferase